MRITGMSRVFAVLGDPIAHSLSPIMHNSWMAQASADAVYVALKVKEESFASFAGFGLAGANVTAPFKAAALHAAQCLSQDAQALGAVNTLWRRPDGQWQGDNTDAEGFVMGLDQARPGWRAACRSALILGAGGAGRAIALGLARAGIARILLTNRNAERALAAAEAVKAEALPWAQAASAARDVDLLINATGFETPWEILAPIVAAALPGATACDVIYRPLITPFLAAAQHKGMITIDGLFMLAGQGALAFEKWFGTLPDQKAARGGMLQALNKED